MNYLCYQNTVQWNTLTQILRVWSVDWVLIIVVPDWRWLKNIMTLDWTFYCLLFKQEVVAAAVTSSSFFFPYRIAVGEYSKNKTLFCSYFSHGHSKDFFEIYRLLAHSPSKGFTNLHRNLATCRYRSTVLSNTGFLSVSFCSIWANISIFRPHILCSSISISIKTKDELWSIDKRNVLHILHTSAIYLKLLSFVHLSHIVR